MAKETKTAAKATQTTPVEVTSENVLEQLRAKNCVNQAAVDAAMAEIEKENDDKLKYEAKNAIKESQYTNMKELLELRKRRNEEKATKKCLNASKESLDKMLAGEITPNEYREEKKKFLREKSEEFRTIEQDHNKALRELQNAYPGYWSYEWDSRW